LPDNSENIILFQNQILFTIEFELSPAIFREQYTITFADIDRRAIPTIKQATISDSENDPLLGLFFRSIRDNDTAPSYLFFCRWLYDHTVANRTNICHDVHFLSSTNVVGQQTFSLHLDHNGLCQRY